MFSWYYQIKHNLQEYPAYFINCFILLTNLLYARYYKALCTVVYCQLYPIEYGVIAWGQLTISNYIQCN